MKALLLSIVFGLHAIVFLRLFLKHTYRIHYMLTIAGFIHLAIYYGYRTWAAYNDPALYFDWISYLRWSGAAMSLIGLPPTAKLLYVRVKSRMARRPLASSRQDPVT